MHTPTMERDIFLSSPLLSFLFLVSLIPNPHLPPPFLALQENISMTTLLVSYALSYSSHPSKIHKPKKRKEELARSLKKPDFTQIINAFANAHITCHAMTCHALL